MWTMIFERIIQHSLIFIELDRRSLVPPRFHHFAWRFQVMGFHKYTAFASPKMYIYFQYKFKFPIMELSWVSIVLHVVRAC